MESSESIEAEPASSVGAGLFAKVEMVALVALFRVLSFFRPLGDLLDGADRRARRLAEGAERVDEAARRHLARLAEGYAGRASSFVPGSACLHRALASRVWLARRGVDAEVVVGLRRSGDLEGHAWLEWDGGREKLFSEGREENEYREVLRS